jgi:hypothetical protein
MLKEEELAFIKAISTLQLSSALLRELWMAVAASKRRKALAPGKAKPSGEVVDEVQSSHEPCSCLLEKGKLPSFPLQTVCLSPPQGAQRTVRWPWKQLQQCVPRMN